jgi:hypothetical protein
MKSSTESTYALLVQSEAEEKNRTLLESILYVSFILSAVAAIWQFALQPVIVPAAGFQATGSVACADRVGGHC